MESDSTTPRQGHVPEGRAWGSASYYDDESAPTSAMSTAPTTPNITRPSSPTSRPARLTPLNGSANGQPQNHHRYHVANGKHRRTGSSPPGARGYMYGSLKSVHHKVHDMLKKQAETDHLAGIFARNLLQAGSWAEDKLENELESRKNAISGIDNLWILLSSTSSEFNPVCTATYTFDTPISFEEASEAIERQAAAFPRYAQKLQDMGRRWHGARFISDPNWSIGKHLRVEHLPEPAGPRELDAFTGKFIAQDWDYSRSLWDCVILENYVDEQSGAHGAMITRGHHTMADGQGFVASQLYITSFGAEMERMLKEGSKTLHDARRGTAKPSKLHKALKPLDKYHKQSWLQLLMFMLYWQIFVVQTLLEIYGSFYQVGLTSVIFLLTFWRQRYATALEKGPARKKEFSASKAFPMGDVKTLQRAFSGPQPGSWADWLTGDKKRRSKSKWNHLTLNDILCTIISDVIADELDQRGRGSGLKGKFLSFTDSFLPNPISLFIPISIRPLNDQSMRNWSTGAIAYLPVGHGMPTSVKAMYARLHANRKRLSVVKNSLLPKLLFWLVAITGQTPILYPSSQWTPVKPIVEFVYSNVLSSFTAVLTNVPGPSGDPITLEGHQVRRWTALPPQAGKGTLGIGIISYANTIAISISADQVPESAGVARRITAKFERRWQQYLDAAAEVLGETK